MKSDVYNYSKLYGLLRERNKTQLEVAKEVGISETALNLKLNNSSVFKQNEITSLCEALNIPAQEIPDYFFCRKSLRKN